MMQRTGWEHYDLEKEIGQCNMAMLLELFKRESAKYDKGCLDYFHAIGKLTEEGKKETEEQLTLLNEGRQKIAMRIAEILTDTKRIQQEIRPK